MAHSSFWKLLSPGKTGAVTHDHKGPPPTPPIPSLQVVEGRTPQHPGVASDLVCVLHFISVQFFKQTEDLLQLCISALLPNVGSLWVCHSVILTIFQTLHYSIWYGDWGRHESHHRDVFQRHQLAIPPYLLYFQPL